MDRGTCQLELGHFSSASPLLFNSVELRDGQQSLLATRMKTEDMLPILEKMDAVGYHAIEMWGGATFDACLRFVGDDPWERLKAIRKRVVHTPLKMLLRGQNLLGYKPYPDDIVERFVARCVADGIDIIEIFDALQDLRNAETAINAAKKAGCRVEGGLEYTLSPFHSTDTFARVAKWYTELGVEAIHIEDMAGLMTPVAAYELIRTLKQAVDVPLFLHCHCTGGMAQMCYWEAIRAGVDGVDCCVSSLALQNGHPAIESMVAALHGTPRDAGLDLNLLKEICAYFKEIRKKYAQYQTKFSGVDVDVLRHQIPGGMLSNLEMQLQEMGVYDRLPEILEEVRRVRADLGYPPLGTPSSQIIGSQATFNVLSGERYGIVSEETKAFVRGMYGRPPCPIDPKFIEMILEDEKPLSCRPADLLPPGYEAHRAEIGSLARTEEDVLSYALFPAAARDFLTNKYSV